MNGPGIMYYNDGDVYNGTWVDGLMSGFGVYNFVSGDRYEGQFSNDSFNGRGIYLICENNSKYLF